MEVGTGLALLGSAQVAAKIFGPSAELLGERLKDFTAARMRNVDQIIGHAQDFLGARVEANGAVHPKVLKALVADASWNDDPLAKLYFGGVLASSRGESLRDDRGAAYMREVEALSVYEIRAHYVLFLAWRQLGAPSDLNLQLADDARKLQMFVPIAELVEAMDFTEAEAALSIIPHVIYGLADKGYITDEFWFGSQEHVQKRFRAADQAGILLIPAPRGAALYLWAHGQGSHPPSDFFKCTLRDVAVPQIAPLPGARLTHTVA